MAKAKTKKRRRPGTTEVSFMARRGGAKRERVTFDAKVKPPSAWSKKAKTNDCREVRNPRTKKKIWLCKTGKGRTGFRFRKTKLR